jgi:hypothetical protein
MYHCTVIPATEHHCAQQEVLSVLDLQSSNSKYLNQLKRIAHPALLTRSKLPEPKVLLLQGESPFSDFFLDHGVEQDPCPFSYHCFNGTVRGRGHLKHTSKFLIFQMGPPLVTVLKNK